MHDIASLGFLLSEAEDNTDAAYRHILSVQTVKSVHVAVDMKQVTLHCMHAHTHKHASVYAPQVCRWKSLMSCVLPVPSASSLFSALTRSSPSDTHTHTYFLLCLLQRLLLLWEPQYSTGWPKDWLHPYIVPCAHSKTLSSANKICLDINYF